MNHQLQCGRVDHIPLCWVAPAGAASTAPLRAVIWLPGFGGSKEGTLPQLRALASAGFLAISFDPWQHGARAVESHEELRGRVVGNIRRHFWPILARTAEEVPRVLDFAVERLGALPQAGMGGDSMGGDIAVAAIGLEPRLAAVAVRVATPDWLRPGSHEPPGAPDAYAMRCYAQLNPLTHLENYAQCPPLSFQSGGLDTQVPASGAQNFLAQLQQLYPRAAERVEVTVHPGAGHECTAEMWANCLNWFAHNLSQAPRQGK